MNHIPDSPLLQLAERCEKAGGPDRELDAMIAASLRIGTEHLWPSNYPAWEGRSDGRVYLEKGGPSFAAPAYTASIDAAMTLVPEGMGFDIKAPQRNETLERITGPLPFGAIVHGPYGLRTGGAATTPALALCAAALRARAAMENDNG